LGDRDHFSPAGVNIYERSAFVGPVRRSQLWYGPHFSSYNSSGTYRRFNGASVIERCDKFAKNFS
jgi:hypothetical protein